MVKIVLFLFFLLQCSSSLDPKRVHLVDQVKPQNQEFPNLLFRGNMPVNKTGFAIDQLVDLMRLRAKEASVPFQDNFYLVVISLNNLFDGNDFKMEREFWENADKSIGKLINWPLGLAGLIPARVFTDHFRTILAEKIVWVVDLIPQRIKAIRQILETPNPRQIAIFVHCTAGCDRTGEVIGSYRYHFDQSLSIKEMYSQNVIECGRAPNYFSTSALEWFCIYQRAVDEEMGVDRPDDCLSFAKCKVFGDCEPISHQ